MVQVEQEQLVRTAEPLKPPKARVVLFGKSPDDKYPQLLNDLKTHFGKHGFDSKVKHINDFTQLEDAISGHLARDRKGQQTIAVIVGQHFEQPQGALTSTLDIDESRLINSIREVCRRHNVNLGRYHLRDDGSFGFQKDEA